MTFYPRKRFHRNPSARGVIHTLPTALLLLSAVLALGPALAHEDDPQKNPRLSATEKLMAKVKLDQKLNSQVPLDITFLEETGKKVQLKDYLGSKPLMLILLQFQCTRLCTEQLNILMQSLKELKFTPGKEFNLAVVSIDPREKPALAAEKKQVYLTDYGRPGAAAGWHWLTGDKANIDRLANALGYSYAYDKRTDQYAHPDGVMILTPMGKTSRYFYRLEYPAKALRLGLVEASANRIGSPLDYVSLLCYHYDPATGTYSLAYMTLLRLAALSTVALTLGGIYIMKRRERQRPVIEQAALQNEA